MVLSTAAFFAPSLSPHEPINTQTSYNLPSPVIKLDSLFFASFPLYLLRRASKQLPFKCAYPSQQTFSSDPLYHSHAYAPSFRRLSSFISFPRGRGECKQGQHGERPALKMAFLSICSHRSHPRNSDGRGRGKKKTVEISQPHSRASSGEESFFVVFFCEDMLVRTRRVHADVPAFLDSSGIGTRQQVASTSLSGVVDQEVGASL